MDQYKDYLSEVVLADQNIVRHPFPGLQPAADIFRLQVTYRVLSRHLKIHVQIAKQFVHPRLLFESQIPLIPLRMLYDFYRTETAKKPKSLHATYLLTGFRHASKPKPTAAKSKTLEVSQDEDTIMASSPFDHSSMAQQGPEQEAPLLRSVIIVPEEKLEETQKSFHRLTSIHIYSVEPAPLTVRPGPTLDLIPLKFEADLVHRT